MPPYLAVWQDFCVKYLVLPSLENKGEKKFILLHLVFIFRHFLSESAVTEIFLGAGELQGGI